MAWWNACIQKQWANESIWFVFWFVKDTHPSFSKNNWSLTGSMSLHEPAAEHHLRSWKFCYLLQAINRLDLQEQLVGHDNLMFEPTFFTRSHHFPKSFVLDRSTSPDVFLTYTFHLPHILVLFWFPFPSLFLFQLWNILECNPFPRLTVPNLLRFGWRVSCKEGLISS